MNSIDRARDETRGSLAKAEQAVMQADICKAHFEDWCLGEKTARERLQQEVAGQGDSISQQGELLIQGIKPKLEEALSEMLDVKSRVVEAERNGQSLRDNFNAQRAEVTNSLLLVDSVKTLRSQVDQDSKRITQFEERVMEVE